LSWRLLCKLKALTQNFLFDRPVQIEPLAYRSRREKNVIKRYPF
jgi:hypothetical protein